MGYLSARIILVTPFRQNCTLLFDDESKRGVLVDPGGDWPRIQGAIQEAGITVEAIWITHGHIDHVGAAMQAKEALDVPMTDWIFIKPRTQKYLNHFFDLIRHETEAPIERISAFLLLKT